MFELFAGVGSAAALSGLEAVASAATPAARFNWNTFVSTLLATVTGATISGTVAYLIYRSGLKERREDRVQTAVNDLVMVLADQGMALGAFFAERQLEAEGERPGGITAPVPYLTVALGAASRAVIVATEPKKKVLQKVHHTVIVMGNNSLTVGLNRYAELADAVTSWQHGFEDDAATIAACETIIGEIDTRKRLIRGNAVPTEPIT